MSDDNYGVSPEMKPRQVDAPALDYLPRLPGRDSHVIGMIGTGSITDSHLTAYKKLGLNVVAFCDIDRERATAKRDKYFPDAEVYTDHTGLLARDDITVVDVATHPTVRVKLVEDALHAGKHVLSQKPFVMDLADGERLVRLAADKGLKLAVNQNGRWAPHFRYLTLAVETGLVGRVNTVDFTVQWNHTWIAGNEGFESIHHMLLYDFAIHWFDIACCFMGEREPERVVASVRKFPGQLYRPPSMGYAMIDYPDAQVRMTFNAHNLYGEQDMTTIIGTEGLIRSEGPSLSDQTVTLYRADGYSTPALEGAWFSNGFEGTMCELLCAIEEDREPSNAAANNLRSLSVCFAALASADRGEPVVPGSVTSM